jgi:ADP-heptose:LPS heptosyltransferase
MKRVLVARLDSVGDVLLAGPAVRAVARDARVTMLCSSRGAPAARLLPGVADVVVWDSPWTLAPAPSVRRDSLDRLQSAVRSAGFDEAVLLTSFHQSPLPLALVLRLAGVSRITGASVDYAGSLLDIRLRPGEDLAEDQPESERALAIAAAAGHTLPSEDDRGLAVVELPDPPPWVGAAPYVVVHPGASVPTRAWPVECHAALVRRLVDEGHRVVVTGAADETNLTAAVAGADGLDLGGRLDLAGLAGVLAHAQVVVVGNTGPAHLAAAVGTPIVSLFSPVVPAVRWAPHGVRCELLGDQSAACRGTRARECPVPGHPCLSGVSVADVAAAVDRLLRAGRPGAPRQVPVAAGSVTGEGGGES